MSTNELDARARDLLALRATIKELEAEAEALTDAIKAEMVERGEEVLQGAGWKASWKNVTSRRFDSKRFKADNPELYSTYSRLTTQTRFIIS